MPDNQTIGVSITFQLDATARARIEAVDPRIRLLDFPAIALGPRGVLTPEELERAKAALLETEVLFGGSVVPPALLREAPRLKWFQVITAGVDALARDGLVGQGFTMTKVSGLAAPAIAEYAIASMLMLCKGLHLSVRDQSTQHWRFRFTAELQGKTCGIVGLGAIGRETARRARAMGMRVIGSRRRAGGDAGDPDCDLLVPHSELHRILAESDYVVVCVPLTDETRGLIGEAELAAMKPTGYLINVARGAVIDEHALVVALGDGTIAGAALDVFEREPLPAENPLWSMENVIVTPHISGAVEGYGEKVTAMFIDNLRRYVAGEPLENVVDPVLAY